MRQIEEAFCNGNLGPPDVGVTPPSQGHSRRPQKQGELIWLAREWGREQLCCDLSSDRGMKHGALALSVPGGVKSTHPNGPGGFPTKVGLGGGGGANESTVTF